MRDRAAKRIARVTVIHPHQWLWEPLAREPSFVLRAMFGAKAVYLDGRLMLCFCAREEPWRGVLVATDRTHHAALQAEFPALQPHPILPKWLYLAETGEHFDRVAQHLVTLARQRNPRLGVVPSARRKKPRASHAASRPRRDSHP